MSRLTAKERHVMEHASARPPGDLVCALQDRIHAEHGDCRPALTARAVRERVWGSWVIDTETGEVRRDNG